MEYRRLGRSDIKVSVICLGTMTWGQQNTEADGHQQMDLALDHGVNFWDTAEMYAVPPRAGNLWRHRNHHRHLAESRTRQARQDRAGQQDRRPDKRFPYIRDGKLRIRSRRISLRPSMPA